VAERIDKMIDMTRVLMQQYLQTDIVRELEVKLLGGAAPTSSPSDAAPAAAPAPAAPAATPPANSPAPPAQPGA
jgi:hypothetical protein